MSKEYKWLMRKDLYEEHIKTFNCFLENKLIHSHNSYEYIVEYNKYLEDGIERLNNELEFHKKMEQNSIECQNELTNKLVKSENIINELEKILNKQIEDDKDTQNNKIFFMRQEDKHILNTIKDLKENKDENNRFIK